MVGVDRGGVQELLGVGVVPDLARLLVLGPGELLEGEDAIWVTRQAMFPVLVERAAALGFRLEAVGEPYEGRIIFRVDR